MHEGSECVMRLLAYFVTARYRLTRVVPVPGNMAGDSAVARSRLQANGAVKPLLHRLLAAQDHPERHTLSTACTAAWALSNLLQDQSQAVSVAPLPPPNQALSLCMCLVASSSTALIGMHDQKLAYCGGAST